MARLWTMALLAVSFTLAVSGCCLPFGSSSSAPTPTPTLTPTPTPVPSADPASGGTPVAAAGGEAVPESFGVAECDDYARKACNCSNAMMRPSLCQAATQSFATWRTMTHPAARAALGQGCASAATSLASACP